MSDDPMPMLDQRAGLTALEGAQVSRPLRRFSRTLGVAFLLLLVGLVFLPWQQFVTGSGRIIAYDPLERSVTVEAPLSGKVDRAAVVEGQPVKKGDMLFKMVDNDPNLLSNLQIQGTAAQARLEAARSRVSWLEMQLAEFERGLPLSIAAAETKLEAARFAQHTAQLQFDRIHALYRDHRGLSSERDFELAKLERDRTLAELRRAEAELKRAGVDLRAALSSSEASLQSARSDLAAAEQSLVSMEIQINQTQMQKVVAPRDGIVFRVQATEGTFLKAGSPLCTIIPETDNRMAELWIKGNDMPLVRAREVDEKGAVVQEGSPVRLQFEGWPAIQFVGWPSVARGTFGGEVVLIDPTDNGKGQFRVLVAPKPDRVETDEGVVERVDWPGPRWLRQGVRVNGWVLLQQVPLWFEVWRQLNGFPPALNGTMVDTKVASE